MRSDFEPYRIAKAKLKLADALEKAKMLLEEEKEEEKVRLGKYSLWQRFTRWLKEKKR